MPSATRTLFAPINVAAGGQSALVAANPSNKIKVISFFIVAGGAVTVKFQSGNTDLTGPMPLAANGGLAIPSGDMWSHLLETAINAALNINLGGAVQVSGALAYKLESV